MQPLVSLTCWLGDIPLPKQLQRQLQDQAQKFQTLEEQQQALNRVISKIRASLDLETIFSTTTKEACKLLQVERIAVYRFFEDWGGEFVSDFEFVEPGWEHFDQLGQNTVWNDSYLQENQGGRYRQNQTLVVGDVYQAGLSQCHLDILEQFHICAYATAPIFVRDQLWGVLAAYQHSKPHVWQETQVQFLRQLAIHLGFAVQQSDLLTETERKAQEVHTIYKQQKILFDLVTSIRETLDLPTLFRTTVKESRKVLQADRVGIFKFAPNSGYDLGEFVAENVLPDYDSVLAAPVTDHCFGERYAVHYERGRIQVLNNVDEADLHSCHRRILKQFQVKAQVITPLLQRGSLWGLLCVHQCGQYRQWQASEIQFIQRLAAQFTVALEHAELLENSRQQALELEQALQGLKQSNARLEELTHTDALTQVSNRRRFDEVLEQEWKRLSRTENFLSLILLDIDYFKAYNDCYGHQNGDTCLYQVAQAARSVLKRPSDLLARYGGEEFAAILPDTDQAGAIQIAEEMITAIAALQIDHTGSQLSPPIISISLGIAAQIPNQSQTPSDLIAQADQALYQAKNKGRNQWAAYSPQVFVA
ncbi:diguanylate cyclase [Synechocystis sp. LKSZ1]|uniref:sensor domain-containing diguanylate cyclase n=1 Tax=Synechocystis sp. LKSZ1 TaxID=3144951 RepID=UPI00336BD124